MVRFLWLYFKEYGVCIVDTESYPVDRILAQVVQCTCTFTLNQKYSVTLFFLWLKEYT